MLAKEIGVIAPSVEHVRCSRLYQFDGNGQTILAAAKLLPLGWATVWSSGTPDCYIMNVLIHKYMD